MFLWLEIWTQKPYIHLFILKLEGSFWIWIVVLCIFPYFFKGKNIKTKYLFIAESAFCMPVDKYAFFPGLSVRCSLEKMIEEFFHFLFI